MLAIQDVLVSDDVVETHFVCDLNSCKGACCWEGDYGAPVLESEIDIIDKYLDVITDELSPRSKELIRLRGWSDLFSESQWEGTTLHEDGSCVFSSKK